MRAFLAIEIEDNMKEIIIKFINRLKTSGDVSWVKREQIHITLFFFEDLKEENLEELFERMERLARKLEPFHIEVKGTNYFGRKEKPRVLFLELKGEIDKLKTLQSQISSSLKELNYFEDKEFHPHLTLGRNRGDKNINRLIESLLSFKNNSFGSFMVDGFTLFKSELKPTGAIHTPIRKFYLGGKIEAS